MSRELKVKFKSLSEEARIIKKEEQKALQTARKFLYKNTKTPISGNHYKLYDNLRHHRHEVVRLHARATHLARGYMKGYEYKRIENKTHHFDFRLYEMIFNMVTKYGYRSHGNVTKEAIKHWVTGEPEVRRVVATG